MFQIATHGCWLNKSTGFPHEHKNKAKVVKMSLLYSSESPNVMCWNSSADCALCPWMNSSWLEDPKTEMLRRYSYGVALPAICLLGIVGNILNLIVLTRRNMRGTAYIYMRGKCTIPSRISIHI